MPLKATGPLQGAHLLVMLIFMSAFRIKRWYHVNSIGSFHFLSQ